MFYCSCANSIMPHRCLQRTAVLQWHHLGIGPAYRKNSVLFPSCSDSLVNKQEFCKRTEQTDLLRQHDGKEYRASDLDEQGKGDENEEVVNDADSSDDDVDDLQSKVTDMCWIRLHLVIQWGRCDVVPCITWQNWVPHHCQEPQCLSRQPQQPTGGILYQRTACRRTTYTVSQKNHPWGYLNFFSFFFTNG